MPTKIFFALSLCLFVCRADASAQDCAPPGLAAEARSAKNMFSPEQEMIFGELAIQNMAGEMRFIRDEKLLAYVNRIGDRLTKHLPPTGLKFQFHLVDLPEANAYNIPGGHILLSRKLVAFSANEDELAGVVAHELGHAVVRHGATDVSETLRKLLNVEALGDRRDVTEKYNLLIERARTKSLGRRRGHEDAQQLEADRVGLFAMVAAGYDPSAFSAFFDRLTESKGKTGGGWFSDLFGNVPPEQKRLREMVRLTDKLPAACREGRAAAAATEGFLKWQADVVSFRAAGRKEELPGLLWRRDLAPKLRGDISHFAFSPDGKYFLAQDDFAVTVVEREPLRVLFQIPVEDANEAAFTPDGGSVILTTENLRYEKWSVAEQKPTEVRELVLRGDCWEHKLSPDGRYLACVDTSTTVNVLETQTGKKVWEKKEFYPLSFFEYLAWITAGEEGGRRPDFFRIEFSPDARFVMFSRSNRLRFRFVIDGLTADQSENTALALDLTTMKPAEVGGDLKKLASRPYLFLDSGRVLGMPTRKAEDAGVFSFPAGKRLQRLSFVAFEMKRTANPDYVVIKPLAGVKLGFYDIRKGIIASGMNKEDATLWGDLMVSEAVSGKVLLRNVSYNEAEKKFDAKEVGAVEVPVGSIKSLSAAAVSDSLDWLLLSSKSRAGVWHLPTGERKFHVRGMRGALVANDGAGVADFPKLDDTPHSLVLLNPKTNDITPIRELPEKGARQFGRFVLLRSSLKEKKKGEKPDEKKDEKKDDKKDAPPPPASGDESEGTDLRREARFELKDIIQDKIIWSRDFPKEAPEFSFDEFSSRLIFFWRLGSDAGKARLKESAELKSKADALGNKADDYLVEVVDAFAQKTVGTLLVETGKGSFAVGEGLSEADWLVLRDSEGRVLAYSIKDGDLRHRFFGEGAALNPRGTQLAVENFPGEVSLYDLASGDRLTSLVIQGGAAFIRFNLAGDKLFVLSDLQTAYAFNINRLAAKSSPRAN